MPITKPLSIILIFCVGIIVYSNTFHCSFHFDDESYIINDPAIRNLQNWQDIWNFYPCRFITFLSIALNYHFNGLHVFGYHLFNLMVHLLSAVLVWWLTLLTLSTPAMKGNKITQHADLIALFTGLVFVSHPVQTEAVTYIWQRATSMAALFYVASLCLYVKSRSLQDHKIARIYYMASLIMAVVAMFTKEMTITLPLMILFYEFSFLKTRKGLSWQYPAPFLFFLFIIPLTIMLLPKSIRIQEVQGVLAGLHVISPVHYLLTQFSVMVTYIRLVFLPVHQNLDYDYPISTSILGLPVLFSFLLLVIILFWAQRLFSKYRLVSFSIFWFFLALLPESSGIPLEDVIVEHRLYLPLAGYSIFLVSSMYYLFGKNSIKAMVMALTVVIAFNSFLTYQRNKVWKDDLTLWNDTVRKSPYKIRPYNDRGNVYLRQGNIAQAMSDFNKVIDLDPKNAVSYINRGVIYEKEGNFTQAIFDFNKAIEINPNDTEVYTDRGVAYASQDNFKRAMVDFNKAIEMNPDDSEDYGNRALAYYQQGKLAQALSDYNKAIEINPKYAADPGFIAALKRSSGQDR